MPQHRRRHTVDEETGAATPDRPIVIWLILIAAAAVIALAWINW